MFVWVWVWGVLGYECRAPPKLLIDTMEEQRNPQIRLGATANLSVYRQQEEQQDPNDADQQQQRGDSMWMVQLPVRSAMLRTEEVLDFELVSGKAVVTDHQFLFVSKNDEQYDMAVDAECIQLHAQGGDDTPSFYLQFQPTIGGSNNDGEQLLELTLELQSTSDCQTLFEGLSRLLSMHPIDDDGEDDDAHPNGDYYGKEDMILRTMGLGEDDTMPSIESQQRHQQQNPSGDNDSHMMMNNEPTEEERQAMLDRLDSLLVVPPHLEVPQHPGDVEGQFDDAEDDPLL